METLADLARLAFEKSLEYVAKRLHERGGVAYVTREDFEAALIALRFEAMSITEQQLEFQRVLAEQHLREVNERLQRERDAGDVPDVTRVPLDGSEQWSSPWKKRE